MPITFEQGDIFASTQFNNFAHGCNCAGAMGKGIAVEFKKRWPQMYEEYRRLCKRGLFKLGDVFTWEQDGAVVFNLGTQQSWTTGADLTAITKALNKMVRQADERGLNEVALPKIGAGLGGLPWEAVRSVLLTCGANSRVTIRVCEEFIRGKALTSVELSNLQPTPCNYEV